MKVTRTYRFDGTLDAFHTVIAEEALYDKVAERSGALAHSVAIDNAADGTVTVTLRRELPTDQVPSFAKGMIGNALVVVETTTWPPATEDGPTAHAEGPFSVTIENTPVNYRGTISLQELGGEVTQTVDGDLKSGIPLVGKKVEASIEPVIVHQLDVLAELVGTALAQR